ncbi:MAG TPA: hypothetical protein VGD49_15565, partial [Longimicrobiales bacterium]
MPVLLLTFLLLLLISDPAAAQISDPYLDASARELVRRARERRQIADVSIEGYKALAKERISAGLRGFRRDRLMYRREVAGRIEWTREGPARIEVLGAREMVPIAMKGVQLPSDLTGFMPHLAFDPADQRMLFGWDDKSFVRHPLAPDAETDYRYRTGGTTSIQLQDGRVVRLIELQIVPRRADPHLINGSFWLDAETHSIVQVAFKLARKIDLLRDLEDEDDPDEDEVPGFLRNMEADIDYVTIEYGLYDLRWWMPRIIAFEGGVRVGPFRMPLLYERSYSDYEIKGLERPVAISMAEMLQRDSVRSAQEDKCENRMQVSVNVGNERRASQDTTNTQQAGRCGRWEVAMSTDTAKIIESDLLPENKYSDDEELLTESDLKQLKDRLEGLGHLPGLLAAPEVKWSLIDPGMARYNRIEALSVGSSASVDFGRYVINAAARIGVADLEPNFRLGITRPGEHMSLTLAAYRRLNGTDPWRNAFNLGSSLTSLFFGREETDFYRSLGVELRGEPAGAAGGSYWWRLYAQRESSADVETQFSVRHLFDNEHEFRTNIVADEIDAVGAEATWRFQHGLNPTGFRFGAELYANAATGTTNFGRGALTVRF